MWEILLLAVAGLVWDALITLDTLVTSKRKSWAAFLTTTVLALLPILVYREILTRDSGALALLSYSLAAGLGAVLVIELERRWSKHKKRRARIERSLKRSTPSSGRSGITGTRTKRHCSRGQTPPLSTGSTLSTYPLRPTSSLESPLERRSNREGDRPVDNRPTYPGRVDHCADRDVA